MKPTTSTSKEERPNLGDLCSNLSVNWALLRKLADRELAVLDKSAADRANQSQQSIDVVKNRILHLHAQYDQSLTELDRRHEQFLQEHKARLEAADNMEQQAHEQFQASLAMIGQSRNEDAKIYQRELAALENTFAERTKKDAALAQARRTAALMQYNEKIAAIYASVDNVISADPYHLANWNRLTVGTNVGLTASPDSVRVGLVTCRAPSKILYLPALVPLPSQNLILRFSGPIGKKNSIELARSCLLRLMLTTPPSKLCWLFVDPVDLGAHFAAFLPHIEMLREAATTQGRKPPDDEFISTMGGGKIWTEMHDIEAQLEECTDMIARAIQKYLRGRFQNIRDYNTHAGMMEVPYRVLCINEFPTKWTRQALERLQSIMVNGPRCGVVTILLWNKDEPIRDWQRSTDLLAGATILDWAEARFEWPTDKSLVLTHDVPPSPEITEALVHQAWADALLRAKDPLDIRRILAPKATWCDPNNKTDVALSIPVGKIGAVAKQYMQLGQGTTIHAAIVGRTGSGKTNLLHAIVASLVTTYSPKEVQLYLIDLKKVEFKKYAPKGDGTSSLPHARLIAVEADREFAVSCLRHAVEEMDRRRNLFSDAAATDIVEYRAKQRILSRLVILVDEVQVLFDQQDALADAANLYLEQLSRSARAFGIHIILASQTFSGFRMRTQILTQMGVRVALQCSEADSSEMIGNKDAFAFLESRGEAVYNSGGGKPDTNTRFQVAWVSPESHSEILSELNTRFTRDEDLILFDGSQLANPLSDPRFLRILKSNSPLVPPRVLTAYIGQPLTISVPAALQFYPLDNRNVLLMASDSSEEGCVGILVTTIAQLAKQCSAGHLRVLVLNFEAPTDKFTTHIAALKQLDNVQVDIQDGNDAARHLELVSEHLDNQANFNELSRILVVVLKMHRSRDFIRSSDRTRFSGDLTKASQLLTRIAVEGPRRGIHVFANSAKFASVSKELNAACGMKVIFRMAPDELRQAFDSFDIRTLQAIQHNRAILRDDQSLVDELRLVPYRPPDPENLVDMFARI